VVVLAIGSKSAFAGNESSGYLEFGGYLIQPLDSGDSEKVKLRYPIKDSESTGIGEDSKGGVDMADPSNLKSEVKYNPETGKYEVTQKIGDINYRPPTYMDFDEYLEYTKKKSMSDYWLDKQSAENEFEGEKSKAFQPELKIKSKLFDRVFGGDKIDLKPSGSAELSFGLRISKTDNPAIPIRNRRVTTFQFDQNMQINLIGSIGDKMKITTNYNTQATFDFQNQFKIDYTGYEDEIIQKIELGNVSLPLNSQLITGSQSLFGVKTKLKFGRMTMTTVLSQDKGQKSEIETKGGAQVNEFEVRADNYEANKHFFLDQFFRDTYEDAIADPMVLNTGVNITRIEVWVTNTRTSGESPRDILAFQDLGQSGTDLEKFYNARWPIGGTPPWPHNTHNSLYAEINGPNGFNGIENRSMEQATPILSNKMNLDPRMDYQRVEFAKKLQPNEYTLHPQLGYISLKQQINTNQVLAVAFEYTLNGRTYQVGEFSMELAEKPLLVKMLKSTETNTRVPMWKLMMKNIYSIGAYRVKKEGFRFDVWYLDQNKGVDINFIPQPELNDMSLVQLLGMDTLDFNGQPRRDGLFDFIDGITINTQNGRIIIPRVEPFGDGLRKAINRTVSDPIRAEAYIRTYAFDSLYTNTQADAKVRFPERNRFSLKGKYQSESSNEIPLNALNVPEGSVTVTAGGQKLTENVDYTVDYNLGRVKIINQSIIESGQPIKVSLESNQLFAQQQKNFFAHRMDYKISDDFLIGGTVMRLWERPLTQKVDIGYEPIANWIWGLDFSYRTELPWLTRVVDMIPGIDTKEKSTLSVSGEFAQLLPGHSKAIGKDGNSYIDDFEGSQNSISLLSQNFWFHSSTPRNQNDLFPEGELFDNKASGINRALINWKVIDPTFYDPSRGPGNVVGDQVMLSNHFMRQVLQQEVFPERQLPPGTIQNINMFDLSFYPGEKGPYNYDVDGKDASGRLYGAGIDSAGQLNDPGSRWGGIVRRIDQNDFEASNIEYIQFWVMDPFNDDYEGDEQNGELIFNLGNISEDIMYDGQKIFEQLLPKNDVELADPERQTFSNLGRVTLGNSFATGFDNDPATLPYQDIGLDGLRSIGSNQEAEFHKDYIDQANGVLIDDAKAKVLSDPSNDDFKHYFDASYDNSSADILERYKLFNGVEGNSASNNDRVGDIKPNQEDINRDNTINQTEAYYQYRVAISQDALSPDKVGTNFISDYKKTTVSTADGRKRDVDWYLFRIPVRSPKRTSHGNINDLRSVFFMRMIMRGFTNPVHLRFARLELVRGEWRRYEEEIDDNPEGVTTDYEVDFNVGAVNLEEHSSKVPVNYVLPPDIQREINVNTTSLQQINEQSLQMTVCDLPDGLAKATYRNTNLDLRMYGKLKMYVHAETLADQDDLQDDDLNIFIRLGSDFSSNYYEYELPMKVTPPGSYNPEHEPHQRIVWPDANKIELDLDALTNLKIDREKRILQGETDLLSKRRYVGGFEGGNIYVVGNPNLAEVKTIMIGVRNPRKIPGDINDDGTNKCAEVWVNELRLSDFDQTNGWATVGQANLKMADLANIVVSGGYSTPGWGSLDKKVSERQKDTRKNYSASAAVNLDKFFPEKWGVKLPMYASYNADIKDPQFSPLAPDIEFKDYVNAWETKAQQDSVKKVMQDRTTRKSLNFTNVRKEKTSQKISTPLDISNFSVSYAYTEENHTDYEIQRDLTKNTKVGLTYNYSLQPKPLKPLAKVKMLRESDYLKLAREMNFYYLPKSFSFTTNMNRIYQAFQMRNTNPGLTARLPEFYNKQFTWDRGFNFKYDLTKNLKFDFAANSKSLILEPKGVAERNKNENGEYDNWKNYVWNGTDSTRGIWKGGEKTNYNHSSNLNYKVPLDYIPILNWVNSNIRYGATYSWQRAPIGRETIGNTVQNSNSINVNGNFNMRKLYQKWDYLKQVERRARRHQQMKNRPKPKPVKSIDENADGAKNDTIKKPKKPKSDYTFVDRMAKLLMSVNSANMTYSRTRGTMVPGWGKDGRILGMDGDAPGWDFIFGQQYESQGDNTFWKKAGDNGWLKTESNINYRVSQTYSENITYRFSAEPIRDLRLTFNGTKRESWNYSLFYRYDSTSSTQEKARYVEESPVRQGTYSVSFWSLRTSLVKDDKTTGSNRTFEEFLANRQTISQRLGEEDPNSTGEHEQHAGYSEGYGPTSADVLIPSFLAAYSGKSASRQNLNVFKNLPALNYRIQYNGLGKLAVLKKIFRSVTVSSGYTSTMTVGGYVQNQRYGEIDTITGELAFDLDSNYYSQFQYNNITISEQFSPLVNVDMQFKNKVTTRFEYKKGRTIGLNVGSAQILETKTEGFTIGMGYQFPMTFPVTIKGKKPKSDLKMRGDFSFRKNKTIIRKIIDETHTPTAGQNVLSLKITMDYALTKSLNLRLFYDYVLNIPQISNSFRTANTNFGFSLRFSIS
tara:strand:- start:27397 stop:34710 length:7314 start_codon:yes stop_codon:yes gene_type:complete